MFAGLSGLLNAWAAWAGFINSGVGQHYNAIEAVQQQLWQLVRG